MRITWQNKELSTEQTALRKTMLSSFRTRTITARQQEVFTDTKHKARKQKAQSYPPWGFSRRAASQRGSNGLLNVMPTGMRKTRRRACVSFVRPEQSTASSLPPSPFGLRGAVEVFALGSLWRHSGPSWCSVPDTKWVSKGLTKLRKGRPAPSTVPIIHANININSPASPALAVATAGLDSVTAFRALATIPLPYEQSQSQPTKLDLPPDLGLPPRGSFSSSNFPSLETLDTLITL